MLQDEPFRPKFPSAAGSEKSPHYEEELKLSVQKLEAENIILRNKVEKMGESIEQKNKQLNEIFARWKQGSSVLSVKENQELKIKLQNKDEKIDKLENHVRKLSEEIVEKNKNSAENAWAAPTGMGVREEIENLKAEQLRMSNQIQQTLNQKIQEIERIFLHVEQAQAAKAESPRLFATDELERQRLQEKVETLSSRLESKEKEETLEKQTLEIRTLRAEVENLKRRLSNVNTNYEQLKREKINETRRLEDQVAFLETNAKEELARMQQEMAVTQKLSESRKAQIESLMHQLESLREENARLQRTLEIELAGANEKLKERDTEVENLRVNRKISEEEKTDLFDKIKKLEMEINAEISKSGEIEKRFTSAAGKSTGLQSTLDQIRADLAHIRKENDLLRHKASGFLADREILAREKTALSNHIKQLMNEKDILEKANRAMREQSETPARPTETSKTPPPPSFTEKSPSVEIPESLKAPEEIPASLAARLKGLIPPKPFEPTSAMEETLKMPPEEPKPTPEMTLAELMAKSKLEATPAAEELPVVDLPELNESKDPESAPTATEEASETETAETESTTSTGAAEQSPMGGDVPEVPKAKRKSRKVFLAESDENTRELLSQALMRDGHKIQVVSGKAGILKKIAAFGPDLLIIDLMLDDGQGFQIIQELAEKSALKKFPVVVLGANPSAAILFTDSNACPNVKHFLCKPFSIREFINVVQWISYSAKK